MTVWVETAARLHFGVLDLRGAAGRWFGGIGAGAPGPTLLLSATLAGGTARGGLDVEGEDAERARMYAVRFLERHSLPEAGRIRIERALPRHAGLGSGTQLALSVARALAELHRVPADAPALARAVGRARRSAVGTWAFDGGGLVVEGGRPRDADVDAVAPLLARVPFPPAWRCVVAVPDGAGSMTGQAEAAAFDALPMPPEGDVQRVAHLVLTALLPSVADGDLPAFGAALTEIQLITGSWWAAVQGGRFADASRDLVEVMRTGGAAGVGQSSWGPTVYGITAGASGSAALARRLSDALAGTGTVYEGPLRATGARVWHT